MNCDKLWTVICESVFCEIVNREHVVVRTLLRFISSYWCHFGRFFRIFRQRAAFAGEFFGFFEIFGGNGGCSGVAVLAYAICVCHLTESSRK